MWTLLCVCVWQCFATFRVNPSCSLKGVTDLLPNLTAGIQSLTGFPHLPESDIMESTGCGTDRWQLLEGMEGEDDTKGHFENRCAKPTGHFKCKRQRVASLISWLLFEQQRCVVQTSSLTTLQGHKPSAFEPHSVSWGCSRRCWGTGGRSAAAYREQLLTWVYVCYMLHLGTAVAFLHGQRRRAGLVRVGTGPIHHTCSLPPTGRHVTWDSLWGFGKHFM